MNYKIIKAYKRLYKTETEIPVATLVIKYVTSNGYVGKVEMPNRMYSVDSVKRAIEKDIEDTMKICNGEDKR